MGCLHCKRDCGGRIPLTLACSGRGAGHSRGWQWVPCAGGGLPTARALYSVPACHWPCAPALLLSASAEPPPARPSLISRMACCGSALPDVAFMTLPTR